MDVARNASPLILITKGRPNRSRTHRAKHRDNHRPKFRVVVFEFLGTEHQVFNIIRRNGERNQFLPLFETLLLIKHAVALLLDFLGAFRIGIIVHLGG